MVLNACVIAGTILTTIGAIVTLAIIPFVDPKLASYVSNPLFVVAFVISSLLLLSSEVLDKMAIAARSSGRMLARNIAVSLLKIGLLVLPIFVAQKAIGIAGAWVVAIALSLPFGVYLARSNAKGFRLRLRGSGPDVRSITRTLATQQVISLSNIAPQFVLPLIVTAFVSKNGAAVFILVWRVAGGILAVSPAVAMSLFAEGSHRASGLARDTRRAAIMIAALVLPAIVFFLLLGHPILNYLKVPTGYSLLVLFAVASIPDAITNVFVAVLRVENRQRLAAAMTFGMALLIIVGGALLAIPYGVNGVGLAWLFAQVAGCGVVAWDVMRRRATKTA